MELSARAVCMGSHQSIQETAVPLILAGPKETGAGIVTVLDMSAPICYALISDLEVFSQQFDRNCHPVEH